jgi:3-oxoacyl-[acyl-carrier-protein] synthase II
MILQVAVVVVLEPERHAIKRGALPIGVVSGYAATCDAFSHFHQEPSGDEAVRAILGACSSAGISPGDIGLVAAHGTGTGENDPFEARVLRRVLEKRVGEVPVYASKSYCGHLLGASGAISVLSALISIEQRFVPRTLNLEQPDAECELAHVVGEPLDHQARIALVTSFGFGARNAALLVQRYD